MPNLISIVTSTIGADLTSTSGVVAVIIPKFEKVEDATISFDDPKLNDYIFAAVVSISGNTVSVTFSAQQISSGNTWATVTTQLSGKKLVVVATGT